MDDRHSCTLFDGDFIGRWCPGGDQIVIVNSISDVQTRRYAQYGAIV